MTRTRFKLPGQHRRKKGRTASQAYRIAGASACTASRCGTRGALHLRPPPTSVLGAQSGDRYPRYHTPARQERNRQTWAGLEGRSVGGGTQPGPGLWALPSAARRPDPQPTRMDKRAQVKPGLTQHQAPARRACGFTRRRDMTPQLLNHSHISIPAAFGPGRAALSLSGVPYRPWEVLGWGSQGS